MEQREAVEERDDDLAGAVTRLHLAVNGLPELNGATSRDGVHTLQQRVLRLLESYTMPRLEQREAPLVVVIGGPTGAGKSTLLNSLVGAPVSLSGALRPTTLQPVMAYNPADAAALVSLGLLPPAQDPQPAPAKGPDAARWVELRTAPSPDIFPGLTLIDSPDLDSRVDGNRQLAARLLAVADLWLFVTTSTDYADVMSWDLLAQAAQRKMAVAVVLNRLGDRETATAVRAHFARLLTEAGLAHAHVFTMPELRLVDGRLPVQFVLALQGWLEKAAVRDEAHGEQSRRTVDGSLDQVTTEVRALADALADQLVAAQRLRVDVESVFSAAREQVRLRCADSSLVTDDLVEAWRAAEGQAGPAHAAGGSTGSRFRRRHRPEQPDPLTAVNRALRESILALMRAQVDQVLFRISERVRHHPLITPAQAESLAHLPAGFDARVDGAVLGWLDALRDRLRAVDAAPADGRAASPSITSRLAPASVLATLAVEGRPARGNEPDGPTADDQSRLELSALLQRRLAHLDDDTVAALAREAWLDLVSALNEILVTEEARLSDLIDESRVLPDAIDSLRTAADDVDTARNSLGDHAR